MRVPDECVVVCFVVVSEELCKGYIPTESSNKSGYDEEANLPVAASTSTVRHVHSPPYVHMHV